RSVHAVGAGYSTTLMESECPTPYNSLYAPMKKGDVVCCMHGSACEIAKKEKQKEANEDETSEQYVNLLDSKKEAPKKDRDDLIQSLALKLRELDVVNSGPKTKNKGARRKELREMKALEKMLRKRKEESSRKMKEEVLGTDDSEEKSKKATEEEASEKKKRKVDRQKRKPDGKKGSYRRVKATFRESPKQHRKEEQIRKKDDVVSPPETPKEEIKENIMDVLNKEEPSRQFKPPPPRIRRTEESSESRHTDDSSKKSIKKDELDISPSASKRLLDDIDESGARKSKRKERRERKKREKKDKREKQGIEPKMFESIRNIMPSDPDQVEKEKKIEDMTKSDSTKTPTPQSLTGLAKSVYIGVCNFAKAEEQVTKRSDFRVYHQLAHRPLLDDLEQELPLIVVYRTANGSFRHYPIRRRKVGTSSYYYVDYGDPKVQTHASLDHLVRYYQINAQRHPENGQYADQFPWWEVHL
ncbi:hypothetical protein V3C99_006731, partial [Haemonchus contortus]